MDKYCAICGKPNSTDKKISNEHHTHFPRKARWVRRLPKELRLHTVTVHVKCHNRFNDFFMRHCWRIDEPVCTGCLYSEVCCYCRGGENG